MGKGNSKRILVIRFSALGDVAMTVPVLLSVARLNPEVRFLFITKTHFAPVLQRLENLDVHPFQAKGIHKGLQGLWRLRGELKSETFDAIADLHAVLRTQILRRFFLFSGRPFESLQKGRREKKHLTSGAPLGFKPLKSTHERYAEVFRRLGYEAAPDSRDILRREAWPDTFDDGYTQSDWIRVGVAPFAAHSGKCYPEPQMKALLALLDAVPNIRLYLFGGGQRERDVLDHWEAEYTNCVSVAGKIPLTEELALISNLRIMISMDSGNGHLAAMYGLPVLTLWGVTHPYAGFTPFNQPGSNSFLSDRAKYPGIPTSVYGNKVPEGYEKVMESIPAEGVYTRVLEILQGPKTRRQTSGTSP